MIKQVITISAIILIYYNVAGLSTTNILRLTCGNTLSVNSSRCVCSNCNSKIPPLLQLPIISFAICKGRCRICGSKIPIFPLILEILIFIGMSVLTLLFGFTPLSVIISFMFYEMMRIIVVIIKGKRMNKFMQQYFIAIISMIPFLTVSLFASLLYNLS